MTQQPKDPAVIKQIMRLLPSIKPGVNKLRIRVHGQDRLVRIAPLYRDGNKLKLKRER